MFNIKRLKGEVFMDTSKKLFAALFFIFACCSCSKGFEVKSNEGTASSEAPLTTPADRDPAIPKALEEAYLNQKNATTNFETNQITKSSWKMLGFVETQIVAPNVPGLPAPENRIVKTSVEESVYLGISDSKTVQKNCLGGPCPNLTMDQTNLEIRSSCQTVQVTGNFEKLIQFANLGFQIGLNLRSQINSTIFCENNANTVISDFIEALPLQDSVSTSTSIGLWHSYLYVGMNSGKVFIFVRQ
jgi:hypothetical protein